MRYSHFDQKQMDAESGLRLDAQARERQAPDFYFRAHPNPAIEAVFQRIGAKIDLAFGEGGDMRRRKTFCRSMIKGATGQLGETGEHAVRARYGRFADQLREGCEIEEAIFEIEKRFVTERMWHRRDAAYGRHRARLDLMVLTEARMLLRWMRRRKLRVRWDAAHVAPTAPVFAPRFQAAE